MLCVLVREHTTYLHIEENQKDIHMKTPALALLSTLTGSNYPCLELISMVPKVCTIRATEVLLYIYKDMTDQILT